MTASSPAQAVAAVFDRALADQPPAIAPHPSRVRVWREGAWWRADGDGWVGVASHPASAQWAAAPLEQAGHLGPLARGALALSSQQPIAVLDDDGRVYLFTSEWGSPGARRLVGLEGPGALVALPPPPLIVVLRPHPAGLPGVRRSTDYVRLGILAGRSNPWLVAWTRRTIHAAGLPDPRGFPNADNVMGALFAAQKGEMAFVKDPLRGEMMCNPADLLCLDPNGLCLRGGDCDDQLIVLGSAASSAGIPIRLLVRRYPGATQAHIVLQYEGPGAAWKCIDPSTDDGACSRAPAKEQIIVEVFDDPSDGSGHFLGIGAPVGDGTLGAFDDCIPESEAASWAGELEHAGALLARASARLRQNWGAHAALAGDLGRPPGEDVEDSARLLATADYLAGVISDGLAGDRLLGAQGAELYIGPRDGDAYAVGLLETGSGARAPVFVDAGEPSSLGAVLEVARRCDAAASAHQDAAAGTLGSVFGYPTVADLVDVLNAAAYNVGQLQAAATACGGWPSDAAGWTTWQADLAKAFADMNAATAAANPVISNTPDFLKNWRDLQDAGAVAIWDQVRAVIDETIDLDRRLRAAGACAAPEYPAEPQPTASDPDLWTFNAAGSVLKGIKKVADNAVGPVTIGIGGVALGVGATLAGLYLLSKIGVLGGSRATASSPRRRGRIPIDDDRPYRRAS